MFLYQVVLLIYRKEIFSALFIVLKQFKMVENIFDIFLSDSDFDEFEGFIEVDIEVVERRSIGSDIFLFDFEDLFLEEELEVEIDDVIWLRQLYKLNVIEFMEDVGLFFVLDEDKKELDFFLKFFFIILIEKISVIGFKNNLGKFLDEIVKS